MHNPLKVAKPQNVWEKKNVIARSLQGMNIFVLDTLYDASKETPQLKALGKRRLGI